MFDGKLSESAEPMSARSGELLETGEEICALMEPRAEVRLGVRFMVKLFLFAMMRLDGCEKRPQAVLTRSAREVRAGPASSARSIVPTRPTQLPSLVTQGTMIHSPSDAMYSLLFGADDENAPPPTPNAIGHLNNLPKDVHDPTDGAASLLLAPLRSRSRSRTRRRTSRPSRAA